ncbi:MAG: single-stranded DNA-binding protein [Oscillospiraceae bacterium]|nr:single-stranded DNA-binding protein [Oscillospiraceae bacterium]
MYNNFQIMGRIVNDLELRTIPAGITVLTFRVAVDRRHKNKDGERVTDFFNVVAWRKTAEFICKYFGKGRMIFLEGEMQIREYTDKNGNPAFWHELIVDRVCFTGEPKPTAAPSAPPIPEPPQELPEYQQNSDDDYPF